MNPKHKHRWRLASWGGWEVSFFCSCGERKSRRMTRAEYDWSKNNAQSWSAKIDKNHIHYIYHQFYRWFYDETGSFKLCGYALMVKLEKFINYYPSCKLVVCDDNSHCSSYVMLIPHESPTGYWGTTMIVAPQYGPPVEMFFYPCSSKQLLKVLGRLQDTFEKKEPLRQQTSKQRRQREKAVGFSLKPKSPVLTDAEIKRLKKAADRRFEKLVEKLEKGKKNGNS